MELKDFAGKEFLVYGLGFHGDNVKIISSYGKGVNIQDSHEWGHFQVCQKQAIIFDYNNPENSWWTRKLVDKKFRCVSSDIPELLKDTLIRKYDNISQLKIIEGTAYWAGIRLGKFWMVELASIDYELLASEHCIPYVEKT